MADVSGLARLKTVPVAEQAYPEPLLEMMLRSIMARAPRAAPGAGVQFPQGEGEAFNPAVAYNPMGQRFGRDPYESYSKMSEGGLPQYEDAGVEMDKKDVAAPLSDFSARSFGGSPRSARVRAADMDDGLARLPEQYQAAVDALRRAFMLRQMQQAQEISNAVPRRADDPISRALMAPTLPEWPVSAPWPGSPRSNRVA